MADTVVLPRAAEPALGSGSPALRLAPQDSADITSSLSHSSAERGSRFPEQASSLGVDQPDRVARELAAKLPLKEQVSTPALKCYISRTLTSALVGFPLGRV